MKFYFGVTTLALLFAAAAGGAMLWDGSYYLYCALNSGHPCVSNNRWITLFLHFPVLTVSHFIEDIQSLQLIFGLTYALVPILILLISWWIVRDSARPLFVWAAFGLGFGTLILQLHFVAEAIISVQLAWPILLAQFVPGRKTIHLTVAILAILLLISHPFAIGLFAMIGVSAILVGWKVPDLRREKWLWASAWIALAVLATARLLFASSAYEAERISFSVFQDGYGALRGVPGMAMLIVFVAAGLVFLSSHGLTNKVLPFWTGFYPVNPERATNNFRAIRRVKEGQVACIILATFLLLIWANNPQSWNSSFSYRVSVAIVSIPFFGLAGLDGIYALTRPVQQISSNESWNWRLLIIQTIGVSFALILCVQSWSWVRVQRQLLVIIAESPTACISLEDVSSQFEEGQMPFHHWSVTTFSLFLQGNVPEKIIMEKPCEQIDFSSTMPVNGWEVQNWGTNRIFDLKLLEEALR